MIPYQHKGCSGTVEFLPDTSSDATVATCRECGQGWQLRFEEDRQGKRLGKWIPVQDFEATRQTDPWGGGDDPW